MLIPYSNIIKKYNLNISNILHVGAHLAEEREDYYKSGANKIIWIEANPETIELLKQKLNGTNDLLFQEAVSDKDNEEVCFTITNNNQFSSILDLGKNKMLFPGIVESKKNFYEN